MKNTNLKMILFDVDSTLVHGIAAERFYKQYSLLVEKILADALAISLDKAKQIADEHRREFNGRGEASFSTHKIPTTAFYDGIVSLDPEKYLSPQPHVSELLMEIKRKGIFIGAVTDGPKPQAYRILKTIGVDTNIFDLFIGWERGGKMPKGGSSQIFEKIIRDHKLLPHEVLMVGDSLGSDIYPAQSIGCKTLHINSEKTIQDVINYLI